MEIRGTRLSLRGASGKNSGDSRRFNRLGVRLPGHVSLVPDSSPDDHIWEILRPKAHPVLVGDLSATGLYFVSPVDYDLGQQIWIELDIHGSTYPIRALVIRQQAQLRDGKKIYGYGVQFLRSRFAPRAVAAILEFLSQRLAVLREREGRGRSTPPDSNFGRQTGSSTPASRRILAKT